MGIPVVVCRSVFESNYSNYENSITDYLSV